MNEPVYTEYLYDAEGRRVAKGTTSAFSCDVSSNGFTLTRSYGLDEDGHEVTATTGDGEWLHTNIYVGGTLLATYDPSGAHYPIFDWLGTRRVQTDYLGRVERTWQNAPFGNSAPGAAGNTDFASYHSDEESGDDYAQARYYNSVTGRFLSPDPSGLAYANLTNPQSFNLYSYALNDPLSFVDPTGMAYCQWDDGTQDDSANTGVDGAVNSAQNCTDLGGTWSFNDGLDDDGNPLASDFPDLIVNSTLYTDTDPLSGGGAANGQGAGGSSATAGTAPNNQPSVSHCLGQAASNGRGLALVADVVGDIATGVAVANPASTAAILVGVAATSVGTLNTLANNPGWSALGITGGTQTVAATSTWTHGLETASFIRTGTSFSKALTGFGILGSVYSTLSDSSAAISAYTNCRNAKP